MFYDLNIRVPNTSNVEGSLDPIIERLFKSSSDNITTLIQLYSDTPGRKRQPPRNGYRGVAITTDVDESIFDKSKKEKEGKKKSSGNTDQTDVLPPPTDLSNFRKKFPKIKFYNRINITVSESSNIRKFTQCKNLKKYDLISFQPESQNALKSLSSIAEIDIVSYNPENKCILHLNRKLYNQFVNQNVYFELMYAPAVVDSTARRNLLSLSHTYKAIGKSRNVIVSSGAQVASYVRGPYDVVNFNLLFGLSEEQSKGSISQTCEKLLLRARKQRRNKTAIEMTQNQDEEMAVTGEESEK